MEGKLTISEVKSFREWDLDMDLHLGNFIKLVAK